MLPDLYIEIVTLLSYEIEQGAILGVSVSLTIMVSTGQQNDDCATLA